MMSSVSIKVRMLYLVFIALLAIMLSYHLAIKRTWRLYSDYKNRVEESASFESASVQIQILQQQLDELSGPFESTNDGNSKNNKRSLLMDIVTEYCEKQSLTINEFCPPIIMHENDFTIETSRMTIEGAFSKILELVHRLEYKKEVGKVISVKFYINIDKRTKKRSLFADIYFQNITNHST